MKKISLKYPLFLASNSPRRKEILNNAGFEFQHIHQDANEDFDNKLPPNEVPVYLAMKKYEAISNKIENCIILSADTIVVCNELILNKPSDKIEAKDMLEKLSGCSHRVITGLFIATPDENYEVVDEATVNFKQLSDWEIDFYIENWQPFDKAGGYGIQDFIGMIGINSINGSFYTIMGLPIHLVYDALKNYIIKE